MGIITQILKTLTSEGLSTLFQIKCKFSFKKRIKLIEGRILERLILIRFVFTA